MDVKSFQTAKADSRYNSSGDLLLTKTSAGVYNDGPWFTNFQNVTLLAFVTIKTAFDQNQDLVAYPDIDPNA